MARKPSTGDGTSKRHLQPIQDPCNTERRDDERMERPPGKPVETRGQIGFYDPVGRVLGALFQLTHREPSRRQRLYASVDNRAGSPPFLYQMQRV